MTELIDQADREDRNVVVLDTAPQPGDEAARPASLQRASDARAAVQSIVPRPWPGDRPAALARLDALNLSSANVVWISDGLDSGDANAVAEKLQRLGSLRMITDPSTSLARLISPAQQENIDLTVAVHRAAATDPAQYAVRVSGEDGRLLGPRDGAARTGPGRRRRQAADAGRAAQSGGARRDRGRRLGGRRAAARRTLAAPAGRHRLGTARRGGAAAAHRNLLPRARAQPVQRGAARHGLRSPASRDRHDRAGRRRTGEPRRARRPRQMDGGGRRAASLCRPGSRSEQR